MILHQCPECDKSFNSGLDLFNHIENYHRQIGAITKESKCPYCNSEKIMPLGIEKNGDVNIQTGGLQGKEYQIYRCENCTHLCKGN
ncbi:MAG: hypothetical protein A3A98_01790 [Candidatus Staskawiczbacteria bacterium RIFCSPLOWO2_01_FULL_40_39]|uniref:C2H2-type domain-containing protein n=1 Tax=Candidatus Staskawiczbacteria bacterium RIFCSPHIGHO2_01_FULL_39_25 TaxID=1802202 RepID=A0A1G2HQ98_9BACT|nr:MAG: hypothetical protein A2730_01945 [Candidatus Staskawiczbacteria bacterium RIFCSPHIGHO2_01_FULL_39_25]OGZ72702.1 MAG: hypothetical protein A3A98_01790 [Candidatus Staskawiczbacteria bacterium RIFCSPLOWO2_01_FULL_40_39]